MKILIASDHAGYKTKEKLKKILKKHEIIDLGTTSIIPVDYPDVAIKLSKKILNKEATLGILICSTGIGMSIAANKVKGIRCAKIDTIKEAKKAKEHNNANVISFSSKKNVLYLKKMTETFINANNNIEERHLKRINKIKDFENEC